MGVGRCALLLWVVLSGARGRTGAAAAARRRHGRMQLAAGGDNDVDSTCALHTNN